MLIMLIYNFSNRKNLDIECRNNFPQIKLDKGLIGHRKTCGLGKSEQIVRTAVCRMV